MLREAEVNQLKGCNQSVRPASDAGGSGEDASSISPTALSRDLDMEAAGGGRGAAAASFNGAARRKDTLEKSLEKLK